MMEHSLFSIIDYRDAKQRKDMIAPYFSRAAINRLESLVQEKIARFLDLLDSATSPKKVVDLNLGFSCLTADVVMHYCYQKTFGALDAPDFQFRPILAIEECFDSASYTWYFPKVFKFIDVITRRLPEKTVKKYLPPVAAVTWIQSVRPFCHPLQPRTVTTCRADQSFFLSAMPQARSCPEVERQSPRSIYIYHTNHFRHYALSRSKEEPVHTVR
jgi:hypothetical protein